MNSRVFASVLAGMALAFSAPVVAGEIPCAADVAKLCKGVPAGGQRIQNCLQENESKLSEQCQSALGGLAKEAKVLALVCRWDMGRFCSDVTPGEGKIAACLTSHSSELSPECKKQIANMKK